MGHSRDYGELKGMIADAGKMIEVGERYRHVKTGGEYKIVDLVLIEADEEVGVVYENVENGLRWVRGLKSFCEEVEIDGCKRRRFERVGK